MRRTRARPEGAADRADQVVARGEGCSRSPAHDLAREPRGVRLVAVVSKGRGDVVHGLRIQPIRRARRSRPRVHPHVQKHTFAKREAATEIVHLPRRYPEIEQHPAVTNSREGCHVVDLVEIADESSQPAALNLLSEAHPRHLDGFRISINGVNEDALRQESGGVAASAKGAIQQALGAAQVFDDPIR